MLLEGIMSTKIGINGFGRIGRNLTRAILDRNAEVELVAVNDLAGAAELAHLLKYDSIHGTLKHEVQVDGETIRVGKLAIKCLKVLDDPRNLPWGDLGVDIVIESTGRLTDRSGAAKHLEAGARKVIISAPAKQVDATFVIGVNHLSYQPQEHHVVSNASCTTNCLAPVAKVLHDSFIIVRGLMTTIHSYTLDQRILDTIHKDWRRARAGAVSMIPTTTGAASAVSLVIPALKGKLDGMAIRVPTPNVSVVDLVAELGKNAGVSEVNNALKEAAEGPLKGIMKYNEEPLVSVDFNTTTYSSIVDAPLTKVLENRMVKVISWYDNEYGYANRLLDLAMYMGGFLR
jgi:glyceraldehyde 3-phosphate dehydrogenase